MKDRLLRRMFMVLMLLIAVIATGGLMIGCAGDNGAAGPAGANGANGQDGKDGTDLTAAPTGLTQVVVSNLTVAASGALNGTGTFNVSFTAKSPTGAVISALTTTTSADSGTRLANMRFAFAKLMAGAGPGDATKWFNFNYGVNDRNINNLTHDGNGNYTYVVTLPTGTMGTLTSNTTGTYAGTYNGFVPTYANYDPSAKWRVGLQISAIPGVTTRALNTTYDFVPDGSTPAVNSRDIVTTAACAACHGTNGIAHGRYDAKYCQVCHTEEVRRRDVSVQLQLAVHQIHTLQTTSSFDASEITFPQDIRNCRTCHKGVDGDNWKNVPTIAACGSCHTTVNFATGLNHVAGAQANNAGCKGCHNAITIEAAHVTEVATANNPNVPAGAANFKYVISSVTVTNSTQPVITFKIQKDGLDTAFTGTGSTASTVPADAVLAGFSGSPSFLISFALPQDGIASPVDFNNLGNPNSAGTPGAAQPRSASIAYLLVSGPTNTRGTITGPVAGEYTATITDPAYGFPAGSKLRTVALQGYFTQVSPALARHTISVVKEVAGESRRSIVDPIKCSNCHEIFEGHGGNRNIDATSTGTLVCMLCHNPNLSSSGKVVDTTYEEATQNMKDMIHSIHASGKRTTPYVHYRAKSGAATRYDWSDVTFPGVLNYCETCHKPGTYDADLPAGVLMTTSLTITSAGTSTTDYFNARATVPNATDLVITPVSATCVACHDSDDAIAHMETNGGQINVARSAATGVEACTVCHGAGRSADIAEMHK